MNETLSLLNDSNIFEMYNLKEKVYISGLYKIKKYSFDTIKGRSSNNLHNGKSTEEQLNKYLKKRLKERKEKIIDLAFSNSWDFFVTLTFDPKNVDYFPNGYSHDQARKLLYKWLNNQHQKNKSMRYIIVSEFHKNGNLHFHGLFSQVKWDLQLAINPNNNKPLIKNGCQVYNLIDYTLGFTTISKIKDSKKVSIYLSKYITKDLISLQKNKKVFWYSRNLYKPKVFYKYINNNLKDYLSNYDVTYYNKFNTLNSTLEVAEYFKT